MTILSKETERKRAQFTQEILDSIRNAPAYCSFYSHVFNRLAALGLQRKAKKEGLFGNDQLINQLHYELLLRLPVVSLIS